nr:ribonuclease H-like domain, reverse transcriptase, RNA-dependent DNA polymerase [Tanacetum cinerariifolium]
DKRECDELVCDNHFDTFSDSKIDDDISVYDDDFKDIEYVEASLLDPEIVSIEEENGVEEENAVQREEEEVDLEDISQVQDVVLREKLFSITRLISNIESLNDNSTPDCVFSSFESDNSLLDNYLPEFETFCDHSEETRSGNATHANYSLPEYDSFCFKIEPDQERLINLVENDNSDSSNDPLLEEVDLFLSDNSIPPGIENVADDPKGDIRFLEELLIDDSILSHESSDFCFEDNTSIPLPPPEPSDDNFDLEPEVISIVMEDNDEPDEYFNLGGEIFVSTNNEDVDYFPFVFVIQIFLPYLILLEISSLLLSAESEDTIFDPGLSSKIEAFLCRIFVLVSKTFNMVAYLSKSDASEGFNQIIDFLNGSYIKYALTVNPTIYVSCIKQFWNTVVIKQSNDVTRLQALVDKKKVVLTEAAIRDSLRLDDAEGVDCLPNEEIFTELARIGYEKPSTKLTFYKAFFSSQWKFLIHTILQSMSAKRTSWNEFS